MKMITAQALEAINDIRSEGLTTLPAGVLEKDALVTEVLHKVATTDNRDGLKVVFCGGTCLSKAHGLIERMSEDVDFKVIVPAGLSRTARSRVLSRFKKQMAQTLQDAGFLVPETGIVARDENSYILLNLHYQSRFPPVASLRPEIKLEFNARPPVLPTLSLPVCTLLDVLLGVESGGVVMRCIGIEEMLAEKVLSFLRRTAEARAGRNRGQYGERLVRHIYDVLAIVRRRPEVVAERSPDHFAVMVMGDAVQYRHQYPEFVDDPIGEMRGVLAALPIESSFARDYEQLVDELVFGERLSFAEGQRVFIRMAERLLSSLADS